MSGLNLALLSLLAAALAGALARVLFLHARVARRTRELESEAARRREVEARYEDLTRLRFALETANRRLRHLVGVDALTGIANRRHFDRVLEREVRRARRDGQPLSLVFLDLDEFKLFNDSYGHARGDQVLRKVAQTLDETFRRGGDLVARYGGEEFAIVLPGVDGRRAGLYAERLRRRIWRLAIAYNASQLTDRVTISGGVATLYPPTSLGPDELLFAADQALYRAKCLGRNRIAAAEVQTAQPALAGQASA
jgi:diguanylate cyclase (GGDEF)-like protein